MNVLHLKKETEHIHPLSPLLGHLVRISEQTDIQEVIRLLKDIRTHQNHPDMLKAFEENNHHLAHGAKNHGKDILELLVEDYLGHNRLDEETALTDNHKYELELHVKHVALSTLKGYQEVVEGIRMDISGLARELTADESINFVRELIGSIRQIKDHGALEEDMRDLLESEPHDLHHTLATMAFRKGHQTREAASGYLKAELHHELREHFERVMARSSERNTSGIFIADIVMETIQRKRHSNPRINAAFSLMEGLKQKIGGNSDSAVKKLLGDKTVLSEGVLATLADDSGADTEKVLAKNTSSIALELAELDLKVEALADLYIRSACEQDYKIRKGLDKIDQYRKGSHQLKSKMGFMVPDGNRELLFIMNGSGDVTSAITQLWLKDDSGNIKKLDQLLDRIATDAQCYPDTDRSPSLIPYSSSEEPGHEDMIKKVRYPVFGSPSYNLIQVLKAASANHENNPRLAEEIKANGTLQEMLGWFSSGHKDAETFVDQYLDQKMKNSDSVGTFDEYLHELLAKVQSGCDAQLYQSLLRWSERRTIPAAPPPPSIPVPPSRRRFRETIPIEYMADVLEEQPKRVVELDESSLKLKKVPYVFEGETYRTEAGQLTKMVYAMEGATIEVEGGSKLDLFMANNDVVIRLMDDNAFLRIQKVTRNCESLRLIGKYGEALTGGPNVELGEGVEEKLIS